MKWIAIAIAIALSTLLGSSCNAPLRGEPWEVFRPGTVGVRGIAGLFNDIDIDAKIIVMKREADIVECLVHDPGIDLQNLSCKLSIISKVDFDTEYTDQARK